MRKVWLVVLLLAVSLPLWPEDVSSPQVKMTPAFDGDDGLYPSLVLSHCQGWQNFDFSEFDGLTTRSGRYVAESWIIPKPFWKSQAPGVSLRGFSIKRAYLDTPQDALLWPAATGWLGSAPFEWGPPGEIGGDRETWSWNRVTVLKGRVVVHIAANFKDVYTRERLASVARKVMARL